MPTIFRVTQLISKITNCSGAFLGSGIEGFSEIQVESEKYFLPELA